MGEPLAIDITKAGMRRKLPKRREPYWRRVGDAYLGYRVVEQGVDGTWIARLYEGGRQNYQKLGRFTEYPDAERALREWLQRRAQGVAPGNDDARVADVCKAYVEHLRSGRGKGPADDALGRLERRVIGRVKASRKKPLAANRLARVKCKELKQHDLKLWRESLAPDGDAKLTRAQRASAQRDINALKAALNYGHEEGFFATNGAWSRVRGFSDTSAGSNSRPYVAIEQRRQLLDACGEDSGLRDLLEGMCLLGARPIELARATAADFDARAKSLVLWSMKGRPAKRRERSIPLAALPGALEFIKRLAKDKIGAAPLFARTDGARWAHSDHDELVRAAVEKAKLPAAVTAYALRHSFITDAVSAGVPMDLVGRVVGTSPLMIAKTYGKLVAEHAQAAFGRMVAL